MQLIIAEKPSLGRNIVDAINGIGNGTMQKKQGYYEGAGYVVTWAFFIIKGENHEAVRTE